MRLVILLIFLFFDLANSIITVPNVETGARTEFNSTAKEFTYEHSGGNNNILLIFIEYQNNQIAYEAECTGQKRSGSRSGSSGAFRLVFDTYTSCTCSFKFTGTGNFVIYSYLKPTKIDLKDTYGFAGVKPEEVKNLIQPLPQLTFLVDEVQNSTLIYFEYNKEKVKIAKIYYEIENPFIICNRENCQEDITTFNFVEGNSYKIYVKIQTITSADGEKHYIIPGFSFGKTPEPDNNKGTYINNQFDFMVLILLLFFVF